MYWLIDDLFQVRKEEEKEREKIAVIACIYFFGAYGDDEERCEGFS